MPMSRIDSLRFWFGMLDLLLATALVVLPAFFDTSNCGPGILIAFACWGVAGTLTVVGILLLITPRVGAVAALLLGSAALIAGLWMAQELLARGWSPDDWLPVALTAPALAQLPFGWLTRRALPHVQAA